MQTKHPWTDHRHRVSVHGIDVVTRSTNAEPLFLEMVVSNTSTSRKQQGWTTTSSAPCFALVKWIDRPTDRPTDRLSTPDSVTYRRRRTYHSSRPTQPCLAIVRKRFACVEAFSGSSRRLTSTKVAAYWLNAAGALHFALLPTSTPSLSEHGPGTRTTPPPALVFVLHHEGNWGLITFVWSSALPGILRNAHLRNGYILVLVPPMIVTIILQQDTTRPLKHSLRISIYPINSIRILQALLANNNIIISAFSPRHSLS